MSTVSTNRKSQLDQLENFISNAKIKLSSIVASLGWSIESVYKDEENFVECPFNKDHRVPENSLEKHLEECQWKAEGYDKKDLPLSAPSLPPGAPASIKFDEELQDCVIQTAKLQNPTMSIVHYRCYATSFGLDNNNKNYLSTLETGAIGRLIPRTSDRLVADFTREERLAMYDYVIKNTLQPDIGEDIADMNKPKTPGEGNKSSYLELLAQERNLKRRRAKYRGVHTNKKSQVEILREIISQQMEMLGEYIAENSHESSSKIPNFVENSPERKNSKSDEFDRKNSSKKIEKRSDRSESRSSKSHSRRRDDEIREKRSSKKKKKHSRDRSREDSRERKSRKSSKKRHKRRGSRDRSESRSSRSKKRRS